jgi:DNA polymerase-3 subunit gamma/tau
MSYLVLARKWRPRVFDDVVGQEHVTRTLQNAIKQDRVAHAMLFTGSRGVGKTSCARILAKALNCESGPTTEPCGTCPACVEITGGTSTDVFEIDGASNNSVEQIREIRESVKFVPARGKRKMYIIDEVHMLTTAAFNALLKTLEEPPAHVLFVFATTEPHKIPETILSRCQRFDFKRIPEKKIVDAIGRIASKEGVEVECAALHHIAREAEGGMRDSLSLLDQVIAFCGTRISEAQVREVLGIADRRILSDLTAALLEGNSQRALLLVEDLFHFGIDLQKFAGELVKHLRDLIVIKVCAEPGRLVDLPDAEVEQMADLIRDQPPARLHRLFSAMMQGADEIGRSPFPKLALEMVLLRLCEQGSTLPLGDVLQGLARLEARLAGGGGDDGGGGFPTAGGPVASGFPGSAKAPTAPPTGPRAEAPPPLVPRTTEAPLATAAAPARPLSTLGAAAALLVDGNAAVEAAPAQRPGLEPAPALRPVTEPDAEPPPAPESAFSAPPVRSDVPACVDPEQSPSGAGCVGGAYTSVPPPGLRFEDEASASTSVPSEDATPIDLFDGAPPAHHFETWVANIRKVDSFLGAELELGARLLAFDDEKVVLALPENTHGEVVPATPLLEQILRRSTGRSQRLELLRCTERDENLTGETIYARRQRLQSEHREARIQAARRDPAVLMAVDVLGASIERVVAR